MTVGMAVVEDSTVTRAYRGASGGPQTRRVDPENGPAARRPDRIGRHGERADEPTSGS
jgi:hypothetical protein